MSALKQQVLAVEPHTGYNRETAEGLVNKIGWELGLHSDELITAFDVEPNRPQPDVNLLSLMRVVAGITWNYRLSRILGCS